MGYLYLGWEPVTIVTIRILSFVLQDTKDRPHLRFYSKDFPDVFTVFEGSQDYDGLLGFVREKTG